MGDNWYSKQGIVFDASPLIYLAKLDALDAMNLPALVPASVVRETTRPAVAYRHRDAIVIESAISAGRLGLVELTAEEEAFASSMSARVTGLHAGECDVLAVAITRSIPAVIFERRAKAVARAFGARLLDLVQVLFEGTRNDDLLEARIRRFGQLVEMRLTDMEALLEAIDARRHR